MTTLTKYARRTTSVGGLDGWTTTTGRAGEPRILARRRFDAAGNVDTGQMPIGLKRGTGTAARALWERINDPATEIVEQVATSTGFHQHRVTIPRGYTEIWATMDFRITARGGDDRTRVIGLANGHTAIILLGVYARSSNLDVWDHDLDISQAVAGGSFAVGDVWRHVVVCLRAENDVRVWLDGNTDVGAPDISTTHSHGLANQGLQFGSGSVDGETTFEIAELAVYDRSPLALTPYSSGWASSPLFQEIVPALSAISLSPDPMAAQDGATSGTVIGTLSTTGGRGDGTWSLTGDLAAIATINGTSVELTTTVSTGDDGTTGTISYTGDSAGGSAADITTSLGVTSAVTNLTLSAASGGAQQQGTLDTSSPFRSLRMLPKSDPPIIGTYTTQTGAEALARQSGYRGFAIDPANTVIIRVDSLGGGTGTGTLRWAATTNTGNSGEDLSGKDVVVVFDVSGHIEMDGPLEFTKGRRWFAGQTAPVDSNGRAGVVIHGVSRSETKTIMSRRVFDSEIVMEHLTFVDGRIPYNDDGSISTSEPPYGALDIGDKADRSIYGILCRNCAFLFGLDETVQVRGSNPWPDYRTDNVGFQYCWFGSPMYNDASNKRGYSLFITRAAQRVEGYCSMVTGTRNRAPWCQGVTSYAGVNSYWYDCRFGIFLEPTSYTLSPEQPAMFPWGRHIDCVGGICEEGPSWGDREAEIDWIVLPWGGNDSDSLVTAYIENNLLWGQPENYDYSSKDYWTLPGEPIFEYSRPPMPLDDLPAAIQAHCGPMPDYRNSVMEDQVATWQAGGSLVHTMRGDGPVRWPEEWPGQNIVATTSAAAVPASPFAVESNGLTVLENWLESEHVAKGAAPYQDFGRWLRFPWGGRIKVETDGTATFDPVDMPAGESGTLKVTRADGSVVSVSCHAT